MSVKNDAMAATNRLAFSYANVLETFRAARAEWLKQYQSRPAFKDYRDLDPENFSSWCGQ